MKVNRYKKSVYIDRVIIECVIMEKTNEEIVRETGYSLGYIKRRLAYLFKLYNVKSKVGLVREVIKEQLASMG